MQSRNVTRSVRRDQIGQLKDLSAAERALLAQRLEQRGSMNPEQALCMDKIRVGDEQEWKVLFKIATRKLKYYLFSLRADVYLPEIISDAVTNAFVSRHLYEDINHLMGALHHFARYEFFSYRKRYLEKMVFLDNTELFEGLAITDDEMLTDEQRDKQDEHKKRLVGIVRHSVSRLPPVWKDWVALQLTTGKRINLDLWQKEHGLSISSRKFAIRNLRLLAEYALKEDKPDRQEQLKDVKLCVLCMSRDQVGILEKILECSTLDELAERTKETKKNLVSKLHFITSRLIAAYPDPLLSSPHRIGNVMRALKTIDDTEFWEAVREGISTYKQRGGFSQSGGPLKLAIPNKKLMQEVYLMRMQKKMSWSDISNVTGMRRQVVQRICKEMYPDVDERRVGHTKLAPQDIAVIRKLHQEGCPINDLASRYSMHRESIRRIIEGRTFKTS